ncbi:MAG TPA: hypothetical protein VHO70_02125 [Chitinispirillaceae bacterium]|nr:hypothetical protein [Chitinispirillaceae bacterium]
MSEYRVPKELIRNLVGAFPPKNKLMFQGITSGAIFFAIFELFPVINKNVPRCAIPWLLMVIVPIAQVMFIARIVSILRLPRRDDLFFIYGLDFKHRFSLVLEAFQASQNMLKSFVIPALILSVALEISVLHRFSIFDTLVSPLLLIGWLYLLPFIGKGMIENGFFKPIRTDRLPETSGKTVLFSVQFAKLLRKFGHAVSSLTPKYIRPLVLRNIFVLFRSETLLLPLFLCAAPMLQIVLILVVQDMSSPFVDLFSLVIFFAMSSWYASLIREANAMSIGNPCYKFDNKRIMLAFAATFAVLTVPLFIVYLGAVSSQLFSIKGILRLLTTTLMVALSAFLTSAQVYDPLRKESEQVATALFFGGGCIGLFISYFGFVFPVLVGIAVLLKEWVPLNSQLPHSTSTGSVRRLTPSPSVNAEEEEE